MLEEKSEATRFLSYHGFCSSSTNELYHLAEQQDVQTPYKSGKGVSLSAVLLDYKLSTRDKITLAYAITLAYWRLYGSKLTRNIWTIDDIWFMPQRSYRVTEP